MPACPSVPDTRPTAVQRAAILLEKGSHGAEAVLCINQGQFLPPLLRPKVTQRKRNVS